MKREYVAFECQHFSTEINEMISIANDRSLKKKEKDKQLKKMANQIISQDGLPPVAVFYQLKNNSAGEEKLRDSWIKFVQSPYGGNYLKTLKLNEPNVNMEQLPEASWLLSIEFTLTSPYTSKDDNPFYILDNSLRREWVFKVPYIAPSQWKGMLRASISQRLVENLTKEADQLQPEEFAKQRFLLTLLFGNEKGEDERNVSSQASFLNKASEKATKIYKEMLRVRFNLKPDQELPSIRGILYFYPTYFDIDKIGFEIINPHNRTTGSGTVPFHLETVPAGTKGKVVVLYVPLYDMPCGDKVQNAIESLELVMQGLQDIFNYYGIGAKTTSGFGLAQLVNDSNKNKLYITLKDAQLREHLKEFLRTGEICTTEKQQEIRPRLNEQSINSKEKEHKRREPIKGFQKLASLKRELEQKAEQSVNTGNNFEAVLEQGFKGLEMFGDTLERLGEVLRDGQLKETQGGGS